VRRDRVTGTPSEQTATTEPTPLDTAHSLRFVLVDQQGHLRGLYDRDAAGVKSLANAMQWLADHPPTP
jgi:cytochrome oxidase Cu insertion factor (SCO1/SenC/PrrC family)